MTPVYRGSLEAEKWPKSLTGLALRFLLTPLCYGCTLDSMATTQPIETAAVSEVPAYRRPADRRTTTITFRIYQDQDSKLRENYDGNSSALIRFLLDKYFNGELTAVVKEFHNL